jgi:hypothetical protein
MEHHSCSGEDLVLFCFFRSVYLHLFLRSFSNVTSLACKENGVSTLL